MNLYSYKYRLKPTQQQKILIEKHFGCTRFVYNYFLNQRIENYKNNKETSCYVKDANKLLQLKKEFSWLKETNSQSLQQSLKHLQHGFDNFFRRCKKKIQGKIGFPRFKSKNGKKSYTIPQAIKIVDNKLHIHKFREGIRVIIDRPIDGKIKFATISKNKTNQYFVSITVEREIKQLSKNENTIGFDLNVKNIVSNKDKRFPNPLPETKYKKRLAYLAKEISRKQKDGQNRKKAQLLFNKWKQYCHNVREDFQHKLSKDIINENQVICLENLCVKSMLENKKDQPRWKQRKLHNQLNDCSFYSLIQKLTYKAQWYGREIIKVDRYFPSSQLCSQCNFQNQELGEEKEWFCWNCWTNHDRDKNAAINIYNQGLKQKTAGMAELAYCPDVRPSLTRQLVG